MMSSSVDVISLISILESSNLKDGREVKELVLEVLSNNKEAWLVNTLIDSYAVTRSEKCLEIITELHEPHDKHVFDRLHDHLRGQHKLPAVNIIAGLVYRQVSWLHKIVVHPLINSLLKCLKTEDSDIPLLLSGLLVITSLLPVVPVTIKDHLPQLFDVFSHLAALCLKASPQVPELYRYHLEVGIYCLHHRLYGMYPYHFLTYLRNIYSKQEQQEVFQNVIKPMVEKVRLHPLLFTTSREKEVSLDRWRHKEVHDILVECAQFSLDLTEGRTTEMSAPAPHQITEHFRDISKDLLMPGSNSLVGSVDPSSVMTSGLHASEMTSVSHSSDVTTTCGSQTSERQTPIGQGTQAVSSGQQSALPETSGSAEKTPKIKKRLSQSGLTLTAKASVSAETTPVSSEQQHVSIPPSPLRPDFTPDSLLNVQQMQAIRKLTFSQTEAAMQERMLEKVLTGVEKSPSQSAASKTTTDTTHTGTVLPPRESTESDTVRATRSDHTEKLQQAEVKEESSSSGRKVAPSVDKLPKLLDNLDKHYEDVDVEVSRLLTDPSGASDGSHFHQEETDSLSHLPPAASMAALMKKVNRIRFNSININTELPEKMGKVARPRSCPTMLLACDDKRAESQPKEDDHQVSFSLESPPLPLAADEKKSEKLVKSSSSQTSLYALSSSLLKRHSDEPVDTFTTATETDDPDADSPMNDFPYQELFSTILPFSPFVQCYYCMQSQTKSAVSGKKPRTQPALDDVKPLFALYSPIELLDHLLESGSGSHQRLVTSIHKDVPAFLSSCDDVAILRGQIEMLHHQLLYERHKRELHAQRNRRLLSRTVKTAALEEQNSAMRDQLLLQENELIKLREALKKQQHLTHQLQHTTATHEAETDNLQKSYRLKTEALDAKVKDLERQLQSTKNNRDELLKELQGYQARLYSLNKEVEILQRKTETTIELEEQVKQLNKELLLMGELQQKYQSRLVAHSQTESNNIHTNFLLETYKTELNSIKKKLSKKTVLLESCEARLNALDETIKNKDQALLEQKQLLETARDSYRQEIESVQDKYCSLKKAHLTLQTEFLNVYDKIGRLESTIQRLNRQGESHPTGMKSAKNRTTHDTPDSKVAEGVSNDGGTSQTWRAPASESSVDSAEEAYSIDTSS